MVFLQLIDLLSLQFTCETGFKVKKTDVLKSFFIYSNGCSNGSAPCIPRRGTRKHEIRQFRPAECCNGEKMCIDLVKARMCCSHVSHARGLVCDPQPPRHPSEWLWSLNTMAKCGMILLRQISQNQISPLPKFPPCGSASLSSATFSETSTRLAQPFPKCTAAKNGHIVWWFAVNSY